MGLQQVGVFSGYGLGGISKAHCAREFRIFSLPILSEPTYCCKTGVTRCPECGVTLEIDDRGKCMFGDPENLRLPAVAPSVPLAVLFRLVRIKVVCTVK